MSTGPSNRSSDSQGTLRSIWIANAAGEPMRSLERADLESGKGIVGDRYHLGVGEFSPTVQDPDHEVTLIEREQLDRFNEGEPDDRAPLREQDARRNLVTEGVDLNTLVGKTFRVGAVELRGIRLCEPCAYLRERTRDSILRGLAHRAGLRAAIVQSGTIACGDAIVACDD